ncbi:MAG: hypothetical protein B5M56_06325 [Desulfococcus sp. 4484_241]|nr:MAG: hypothetical protein B5M56_06325 [Desulfococcus sp. 4484_241]
MVCRYLSHLRKHGAVIKRTALCTSILIAAIIFSGCATTGDIPANRDNICRLFKENGGWFKHAYAASKRWGIPVPVLMAIMHQESRFNPDARPPRTTCLCILPGPRPSSAYGYAQALDTTWKTYKRATGNYGADRDDFADAIDFIGWYCHLSRVKCGIAANDAYSLYIAYHEGQGGYLRGSYRSKPDLIYVARKVKNRAALYARQYASCGRELRDTLGCCLWPF